MRILALEPYYGGSHKAFLDGWSNESRHDFTILDLPAFKWKWRMRHSSMTFAEQVRNRADSGERWDLLFCSDMVNLAEFLGLAPASVRELPSVAYFHENQLTYPTRHTTDFDFHFSFSNMVTGLAATQVWFNSQFNRESFLDALPPFLKRMPDFQPLEEVEHIRGKSSIHPPGIDPLPPRGPRRPGPLRILWAARWEHDKNPEDFFEALRILEARNVDFRVSVIGQRFREQPPVFNWAHEYFAGYIDLWGHQPAREDYVAAMLDADVIVSTALHEFFGIGIVEGAAAGCHPMVPRRLSYPEVLSMTDADTDRFFYDGSPKDLARELQSLAENLDGGDLWQGADPRLGVRIASRYVWCNLAPRLDAAVETISEDGAGLDCPSAD